ncbi:MAG: hypothetical protein IT423_10550, partial [Pirellulaceae bacterium]|nr:hypothetical protein [Pirellulaceae bacterium]
MSALKNLSASAVAVIALVVAAAAVGLWLESSRRADRHAGPARPTRPMDDTVAAGSANANATHPNAGTAAPNSAAAPAADGATARMFQAALPRQTQRDGFVSSAACQECHQDQFDTWHDSFHRTMTQVAHPSTVVAPFEGVRLA